MSLSQKDYQAIANTFAECKPDEPGIGYNMWHVLVKEIARTLANGNPRFNKIKFQSACGITNENA